MSAITDIKTVLKKILLLVDEISSLNSDNLPKLKDNPNNLLEAVESFEREKNGNLNTIESNTDQINSLKNKISQNEREIVKLGEEIEDLSNKKTHYLNRIQELQNKLTQTKEEIKNKTSEYERRNERLKELENIVADLKIEQDKFDQKISDLKKELEGAYLNRKQFVENYTNRVEAMNMLIRNDYIQSSQIKLIRALQKDAALDLENVLKAIDLRRDKAHQILKKMVEENGPIEYDEQSGTVTLLKEVDFR